LTVAERWAIMELNTFKNASARCKIMDIVVTTYALYVAISVGLTVWVACTLSKNGALFLIDVFSGNQRLADAVNHLLVVGFYLINLGYISLTLKLGYAVGTVQESRWA
jgi:hypothetical protein